MFLTEVQITALCENQTIKIDGSEYTILPLVQGTNQKGGHSIRIKIANKTKKTNTRDKGTTTSVPIDLNTGMVREEEIEYGKDVKSSDRKYHKDIATGLGVYALDELIMVSSGATTENVAAFNKKAIEYSKLSKKERKMYIDMGNGDI